MHLEVLKWTNNSTTDHYISNGIYETARNSASNTEAWRRYLHHNIAIKMNEICKHAMAELGYRTGNDNVIYKNMSYSLVGHFPLPSYITL